jgi:hypothetical protein
LKDLRAKGEDRECHGSMRSREHVGNDSSRICEGRAAEEAGKEATDEEGFDVLCGSAADVEELLKRMSAC